MADRQPANTGLSIPQRCRNLSAFGVEPVKHKAATFDHKQAVIGCAPETAWPGAQLHASRSLPMARRLVLRAARDWSRKAARTGPTRGLPLGVCPHCCGSKQYSGTTCESTCTGSSSGNMLQNQICYSSTHLQGCQQMSHVFKVCSSLMTANTWKGQAHIGNVRKLQLSLAQFRSSAVAHSMRVIMDSVKIRSHAFEATILQMLVPMVGLNDTTASVLGSCSGAALCIRLNASPLLLRRQRHGQLPPLQLAAQGCRASADRA